MLLWSIIIVHYYARSRSSTEQTQKMQTHKNSHKNNITIVVKNDEKCDYKSIKRPVSTAFRTLYCQILCLIASHETFNLMLYSSATHSQSY